MSFNLAVVLRESRNAHPDKPLCHIADQTFSYAEVDEISGRIAASLRTLGVRPGDKVAVQLPNVPHFLFAYFGILKAGAVMVTLDPLLRAREIRYHLRDSDSRLLITFETSADEAVKAVAKIAGLSTYVVNLPGNDQRPRNAKSFDELCLADDADDIEPTDADDTAVITYTSGTTGKPKGAELTHHQLYMNCTANGERFRFRDDDVSMSVLPMFHVFGLSSVLNVAVRFGGTLVLVPSFGVQTVVDELVRRRCTIFSGVPTMYRALLQADTDGRDLSALRLGVSGDAAIPAEVIGAFEEKFPGAVLLEGYGSSQTISTATVKTSAAPRKMLSIGKPIWEVVVRVVESPPGADNVERTTGRCAFAAVLLLFVSVLPWRRANVFGGQLDGVVLGKLALMMAAGLIVLWAKGNLVRNGRSINAVMAPALLLVAVYSGSSAIGAFLFGRFLSSVELSVRVLAVGFVALVLIELVEPMIVIGTLSRVFAAAAIFISATGSMYSADYPGRLVGGIPPITPNEIALLAAVPLIYFVWRMVNVGTSYARILVAIALGVILLLTQSRTTIALTVAIVLFLTLHGTRNVRLRLGITILAVVSLVFILAFTDVIQSFGSRGGKSSVESAGARTIAWNAVLQMNADPLQKLFGQGLSYKFVTVEGQYWNTQVMDSSWFSAFVQAGLIGLVLALALVGYAVMQALRNTRPAKNLWLALLGLVGVRSIFESGLLDTSTSFIVFMMVSMGAATQAHLGSFSGRGHFDARV